MQLYTKHVCGPVYVFLCNLEGARIQILVHICIFERNIQYLHIQKNTLRNNTSNLPEFYNMWTRLTLLQPTGMASFNTFKSVMVRHFVLLDVKQ